MRSPRVALSFSALVLALIVSACSVKKYPSVRVAPYQADVVFGVQPQLPPLEPVGLPIAPSQAQPVNAAAEPFTEPTIPIFTTPLDLTPPPGNCPAAALDAFPDQTAPVNLLRVPRVGQYRWKTSQTRREEGQIVSQSSGFQQRLIRRVAMTPRAANDNSDSQDFTFQQVEPYGSNGSVLVITYQVKSDVATQRYESPPTGQATAFVSTPDAGLDLVSEVVIDRSGNSVPLFQPTPPLLLFPLPVQPGARFSALSEDLANGRVVAIQGTVLRRSRIDACGTIVEGWLVTGTETLSSPPTGGGGPPAIGNVISGAGPSTTINFNQTYATQYGAMPIDEETVQTLADGSELDVDDTLGQRDPSPLPPGTS